MGSGERKDILCDNLGGIEMKMVFRITAIFNLCLVVLSFVCVVMGAINRSVDFVVISVLIILLSCLQTTLMFAMLALFNEFK